MNNPTKEPSFPYRAWSVAIIGDRTSLETHLDGALNAAHAYHINRLELHDDVVPWVNAGIGYRDFPRLHASSDVDAAAAEVLPEPDPDGARAWMQSLFGKVKAKDLKLNVWYHVGRNVPERLGEVYPEYLDVDSGFVYRFEEACLTEFFELHPEVDGITVTSLHETDSILWRQGKASRKERLVKLYKSIHAACKKAGKDFILRGFIVKHEDYADFNEILDELPEDIIVMSKEALADWCHIRQGKDPFLQRFARRRLVVEFDLYGEYQGRTAIPYTDPEYYWHSIRELAALGVEGAVGRIVHDHGRETEFATIFDSFNEVNVAAFSNTLYDTGATIESLGEWSTSIDSDVGMRLWLPWAKRRFGREAAAEASIILRKCPELVERTLSICGFYAQSHSSMMTLADVARDGYMRQRFDPIHPDGVLENWIASEPLALDLIRRDKDDLVRSVRALHRQAIRLAACCSSQGTRELVRTMETFSLIAEASRSVALIYALGVLHAADHPEFKHERRKALALARKIASKRSEQFHFGLSGILREWAGSYLAGS